MVDLSALYFDILKDRLYTAGKKSPERRSSQTAMWLITDALIRVLAPVLSFTSEEFWASCRRARPSPSRFFSREYPNYAKTVSKWSDPKIEERFTGIWAVRDVVLKALEEARQAKTIGHPREAKVILTVDAAADAALKATREELSRLFLVSELEVKKGERGRCRKWLAPRARKCARCWTYSIAVGKNQKHPDLCNRCVEALQ